MLFKDLGIRPGILKSLDFIGYKEPTPIQEQVITLALKGENIVGQSQTGTGKTAAFVLPILDKLDPYKKGLQALIVAPTRELVNQIGEEIFKLNKYHRVNYVAVYGGSSSLRQKSQLRTNPHIIVATPGRLMDFVDQRVINLASVKYFVLDEVDRMLDMGFVDDIKKIRSMCPNIEQTMTFSATINSEIKNIINSHVQKYEFIKIGEQVTVDKIDHSYVDVGHDDKFLNLKNLIDIYSEHKILIFTQTKRNTDTLYDEMVKCGIKAGALHGDMRQFQRNSTIKAFKKGEIRVLVTTDVAARGLNLDNVGLVINFDVPMDAENYIHRIGRTGRAGADGKALMLVSRGEYRLLENIEKEYKMKLKKSDYKPVFDLEGKHRHLSLDKVELKERKRTMGRSRGGSSGYGRQSSYGRDNRGGSSFGNRGGYSGNRYDKGNRFAGSSSRDSSGPSPRSSTNRDLRSPYTSQTPRTDFNKTAPSSSPTNSRYGSDNRYTRQDSGQNRYDRGNRFAGSSSRDSSGPSPRSSSYGRSSSSYSDRTSNNVKVYTPSATRRPSTTSSQSASYSSKPTTSSRITSTSKTVEKKPAGSKKEGGFASKIKKFLGDIV